MAKEGYHLSVSPSSSKTTLSGGIYFKSFQKKKHIYLNIPDLSQPFYSTTTLENQYGIL